MNDKSRILIQLDTDPQPSVFDQITAIDAGAQHVLSYSQVTPRQVASLVHGAIFTRGVKHLKHTAIFIGGSDVAAGEALLKQVQQTFLGPLRVSVMLDSNGANTTAAAAVLAAQKHVALENVHAAVLGGTGPVGQRVAQLLAAQGAHVRLTSRQLGRAQRAADEVNHLLGQPLVHGHATGDGSDVHSLLNDVEVVIASGAAGVCLLPAGKWQSLDKLRVAIDLNAVPPTGIEGIDPSDQARTQGAVTCYGAIGAGSLKMQIHKAAVAKLFESNEQTFDTETIYALAREL